MHKILQFEYDATIFFILQKFGFYYQKLEKVSSVRAAVLFPMSVKKEISGRFLTYT